MSNQNKYDSNITAGALLYNEFTVLAEFLTEDFLAFLDNELILNSKVGISSESSRKRIFQEIKRRYVAVPKDFWGHFVEWNEYTQRLALFYVCLKTYPLIFDLHWEVGRKKFSNGQSLGSYDIQMRLDELASDSAKVASWSFVTIDKINSQYRKLIRQAGLYDRELELLKRPSNIDPSFWIYIEDNSESWFKEACFL